MQMLLAMLVCLVPCDPPKKSKSDDEARKPEKNECEENEQLQPSREKKPEGEGHLRRRADWFQKRTGGAE